MSEPNTTRFSLQRARNLSISSAFHDALGVRQHMEAQKQTKRDRDAFDAEASGLCRGLQSAGLKHRSKTTAIVVERPRQPVAWRC